MVICPYCKEQFDADTEPYIKVQVRRYAHVKCAEQHAKSLEEKKEIAKALKEIAANEQNAKPANMVKCMICGELVDKTNPECVKATSTSYAHRNCLEQEPELLERTKFYDYVSQLFGTKYNHLSTMKLAERYMREHPDWTWSGMHKAMWFFYEKKHGDKSKANGTIGILPYIYQQAYSYFFELFLAEEAANSLDEEAIKTTTRKMVIKEPIKPTTKRKANIIEFEEDDEL